MNTLGTFEIESGSVMVSDPCYKEGTPGQFLVDNVLNGTWVAEAEFEDGTVKELRAYHSEFRPQDFHKLLSMDIGVDSGQAGFFDSGHYRKSSCFGEVWEFVGGKTVPENSDEDVFYNVACDISMDRAGAMKHGVNSSSGYGDGCYTLYACIDPSTGVVIGLSLSFIDSDEEYDEEEDYGYDDEADVDEDDFGE